MPAAFAVSLTSGAQRWLAYCSVVADGLRVNPTLDAADGKSDGVAVVTAADEASAVRAAVTGTARVNTGILGHGLGDLTHAFPGGAFRVASDPSYGFWIELEDLYGSSRDDSDYNDHWWDVSVTAVANRPPVANSDAASGRAAAAVTVAVRANDADPDGDPLTVTGVGPASRGTVAIGAGGTAVVYTPNPAAPAYVGTDSFSYTVSDGRGGTASAAVTVTLTNAAPTVTPVVPAVVPLNQPVSGRVLFTATDTDGDPLTVALAGLPAGLTFDPASLTVSGTATQPGTFRLTATADDKKAGGSVSRAFDLVVNRPPAAKADAAAAHAGTTFSVPVLGNDSDPDGHPLALAGASGAQHGTVAKSADGKGVVYTPGAVPYHVGTDTFTYTVSDGYGGTAAATVTVTLANAPPTVTASPATVQLGKAVSGLSLLTAADADGDPLVVALTGLPAGLTFDAITRKVSGTPTKAGTFPLTATADDRRAGGVRQAAFQLVVNTPPVARDDTVPAHAGTLLTIDPRGNDSDADGDQLFVAAIGSARYGAVSLSFDRKAVEYEPHGPPYEVGEDEFTYVVADGRGGFDTATVFVLLANQVPQIHAVPPGPPPVRLVPPPVLVSDVIAPAFALFSATDADGDPLQLSVVPQPGSALPAGVQFKDVGGQVEVSGTPSAVGVFELEAVADDQRMGGRVTEKFQFEVVPRAQVVTAGPFDALTNPLRPGDVANELSVEGRLDAPGVQAAQAADTWNVSAAVRPNSSGGRGTARVLKSPVKPADSILAIYAATTPSTAQDDVEVVLSVESKTQPGRFLASGSAGSFKVTNIEVTIPARVNAATTPAGMPDRVSVGARPATATKPAEWGDFTGEAVFRPIAPRHGFPLVANDGGLNQAAHGTAAVAASGPAVAGGGVVRQKFVVTGTTPTRPSKDSSNKDDFLAANAGYLKLRVKLKTMPAPVAGSGVVDGPESGGFSVADVPLAVEVTNAAAINTFSTLGAKYTLGFVYDGTTKGEYTYGTEQIVRIETGQPPNDSTSYFYHGGPGADTNALNRVTDPTNKDYETYENWVKRLVARANLGAMETVPGAPPYLSSDDQRFVYVNTAVTRLAIADANGKLVTRADGSPLIDIDANGVLTGPYVAATRQFVSGVPVFQVPESYYRIFTNNVWTAGGSYFIRVKRVTGGAGVAIPPAWPGGGPPGGGLLPGRMTLPQNVPQASSQYKK